jgi:hypothetical protein
MTPVPEDAETSGAAAMAGSIRGQPLHPRVRRLRDLSLIVLAYRSSLPVPTAAQIAGLSTDNTLAQLWADWEARHAQSVDTARPRGESARSERRRLDARFETSAARSRWRTVVPRTLSLVVRIWSRWLFRLRRNSASR